MNNSKEFLVNIDIKGKGTIKNKTMRVEGSDFVIEGIAGAWFWIKKEECFRMGKAVFHAGHYTPDKEITCSISLAESNAVIKLPFDKITLNGVAFEKFDSGEQSDEIVSEIISYEKIIPAISASASDENYVKKLDESKTKISELEAEKKNIEIELHRLKSELESAAQKYSALEKSARENIQDEKQRMANLVKERKDFENEIAELKKQSERSERLVDAYKNELEDLKMNMEAQTTENKLTLETYEKALQEKRKTLAKVNKWMSRVAGIDEEVNPNEKAAKIEKIVLERWNLLEENKRLRDMLDKQGLSIPEPEKQKNNDQNGDIVKLDRAALKELEDSFKYVVVSIHMANQGNRYETLDKVDRVLNSFHVMDPKDEGLIEKDLLVVRDYFDYKTAAHTNSGTYELGAMINFFKDELEKVLDLPDFTNPHQRVGLRQNLRDVYDDYTPKSKR